MNKISLTTILYEIIAKELSRWHHIKNTRIINYCKPTVICDDFILQLTADNWFAANIFSDQTLSRPMLLLQPYIKNFLGSQHILDDEAPANFAFFFRTRIKVSAQSLHSFRLSKKKKKIEETKSQSHLIRQN